jgi:phosphatidylinositol glycan class M
MLPNEFLHPLFGKFVFALCDLLVGLLLYHIFLRTGISSLSNRQGVQVSKDASLKQDVSKSQRLAISLIAGLWLLNPIVANISTRGSAESVLGAMVVTTHFLILSGHLNWAAIMFGLAVHFKIYPIIYGASIIAWIDKQNPLRLSWTSLTRRRVRFAVISALSFFVLSGIMFAV